MRKFKLLKDLPTCPAGTISSCSFRADFYDFCAGFKMYSFMIHDIETMPDWFEEIKSEKVKRIAEIYHRTKKWINPSLHPIGATFEYMESQFVGSPKIHIPDFDALAKELYTKDEVIDFANHCFEVFNNKPHWLFKSTLLSAFKTWEERQLLQ